MEMSERYSVAPWAWAEHPDIWMLWATTHQAIKAEVRKIQQQKPQ